MKVLLLGGSARSAAPDLASSLAAAGHSATVVEAAHGDGETRIERRNTANSQRAIALVRADPDPTHWQRTRSRAVADLVRALLVEEAPDLVHVLGWRGLTHDLVAVAAREGVRAVVTLSDPWLGCLVGDRVRADLPPGELAGACAEPLGPSPCLACAEARFGRTPWVPIEARFLAVAERRRDALRELALARRVVVADVATADAMRRALADELAPVAFATIADPRDGGAHAALYAQVVAEPAPERATDAPDWWVARMQDAGERAWDEACRAAEVAR